MVEWIRASMSIAEKVETAGGKPVDGSRGAGGDTVEDGAAGGTVVVKAAGGAEEAAARV
jgi:hypothetical protein